MDNKSLEFDPQQALLHAQTISMPRLVGTDQEKQTGQYIAERMEAYGFQVRAEEFHFSDIMSVFLIVEILLSQILIILTIWMSQHRQPIQSIIALILITFLFLINGLNRLVQDYSLAPANGKKLPFLAKLIQRMGRYFHTANYVAHLPGPSVRPEGVHLTLIAHYDTKSQSIPLVARMALFSLGIGCEVLFAIFILLAPFLHSLSIAAIVIGVVAVLLGIPLLFLDLGNESPGAIDNASSVGVVLQLAEVLAHKQELCQQLDLTFLFTSAEEISTVGALAYVLRHEDEVRKQVRLGQCLVINLDGVGVDGSLYWVGRDEQRKCFASQCLYGVIRQACLDLNIELKRFNLPGALYDHIPFSNIGSDACTLIAINRKSLSVHTREDTVEQLDLRGFQQTGLVVMRAIDFLSKVSKQERTVIDTGIDKSDLYKNDPLMRFMRDKMQLTPLKVLLATVVIGIADLLIAKCYNLLTHNSIIFHDAEVISIIAALKDPPYLLTIFVIIPLFFYTYIWMPDGIWCLFQSLPQNGLIKPDDMPTYRDNLRILVGRYNRSIFYLTCLGAIVLEIAVIMGNSLRHVHTYNAEFPLDRLVLFRNPYGLLALYCATAVIVRWIRNSDWKMLFKNIEPQVNPLHRDMAAGYGSFADCIINMFCIFIAIATFFFTLMLFTTNDYGTEVIFKPEAAQPLMIVSTIVYLIVGYILFIHIPSSAARQAINQAKNRQNEIVTKQYNAEQKVLMELTVEGTKDPDTVEKIKVQLEKIRLLNETSNQIQNIPSSPVSRRLIRNFGASYIFIYLPIVIYNLSRAYASGDLEKLLQGNDLIRKFAGLISILFTGR